MPAALHQQYDVASTVAASTTLYTQLGGGWGTIGGTATEADAEMLWRQNGTFSNLLIHVVANDRGTSTFKTRKATADGNLVISFTGTGKFEDTTHSDAVTAGEDWHAQLITGAGGTVFGPYASQVLFTAADSSKTVLKAEGRNATTSVTSATRYGGFFGRGGAFNTSEAAVAIIPRMAVTLSNLFCFVSVNGKASPSTATLNINGSPGTCTASLSGLGKFEDTTHSDAVTAGQTVSLAVVLPADAGTLTILNLAVDITSTAGQYMLVCGNGGTTVNANLTRYLAIAGSSVTPAATESDVAFEANISNVYAAYLETNISAITMTDPSTLTFRKNSGGTATTLTVSITGTGVALDSTHSDAIAATDTLDYRLVTGATGTSLSFAYMSVVVGPNALGGHAPMRRQGMIRQGGVWGRPKGRTF